MALTDAEFILLGSGSVVVYCWETPRGPRLRWENDSKMKIKKKNMWVCTGFIWLRILFQAGILYT
jgi:hypothetical protein